MIIDMNRLIEHQSKEILKNMVDNTQGFTENMRYDLKGIIDMSRSPEELVQTVLLYFSAFKWS